MHTNEIVEDFFTGEDGRKLFMRHIEPDSVSGVVTILHGYGEHGGRYLETMARFAARGYAVYCPDHRGFGGSERYPGDIESIDLVCHDVHHLTTLAKERYPGEPSILVGHSLGGMLSLNQLLEYQDDYDVAVVSGPAVLPPPNTSPLLVALAGIVARIAPRLGVQEFDDSAVTRNDEMIARDDADPILYKGKILARTGFETLKTQKKILSSLQKITLPILIMHGGDDRVIAPRASELVSSGVGSGVKEHIVFPGLFHEIFNEPERDDVFNRTFAWLESVLR